MSKTFRQYPQIVVHPPDESLMTGSLPDINAASVANLARINNVSDLNVSYPDLMNSAIFSSVANLKLQRPDSPRERLQKNWKVKHSASMHDLLLSNRETDYNNYHTVHGGCTIVDKTTDRLANNYNKSETSTIVKCCCNNEQTTLPTVMPIQQYLETYFVKPVRRHFIKWVEVVGRLSGLF